MSQEQSTSGPGGAMGTERAATMQDIAVRCGVTKQTVSRVFMDHPNVRPSTRARILEVAEELGYDPSRHHAARRMALSKHGRRAPNQVMAVFFPPATYRSNYTTELFWGIWEGLDGLGYSLLAVHAPGAPVRHAPAPPPAIRRGEADAAIVLSRPEHFAPVLDSLRTEAHFGDRPVVFVVWTDPECSVVTADFPAGAREAIAHLLSLGHRHILCLYHDDDRHTSPVQGRLAGSAQACRDAGLDPDQHLAHMGWRDGDEPASARRVLDLLRERPEITAILARNDAGAALLAATLRDAGLRVPRDISLIGFDDTDPLLDERGRNILTTIHLPLREIGLHAARLAVSQVANRAAPRQTITLPTPLTLRATTAPPREK